jgi:acyl dehydratase
MDEHFASLHIGKTLPVVSKQAITRSTLALFAGASNDDNPLHIDIDFARAAGLDDVIAHGMLIMAYLGQVLTVWVPQTAIRSYEVKFAAMTGVGDQITCQGEVIDTYRQHGENLARVAMHATDQHGETKISGQAVVAFGPEN